MDSETTTVQSIHQPPNLTPTPGCWNGQWEWLVKQREIGERCAYIFTETCLNITYQAVVLDGPIEFRANRAQDMEGLDLCLCRQHLMLTRVFNLLFFLALFMNT